MLTNNTEYKYETLYTMPFFITQCWNNGTVTLQCISATIVYNIHRIKPYTSDTNVKDIAPEICMMTVNILSQDLYLYIILKFENKVYNRMSTKTMTLSHIGRAREFFRDDFTLST